MCSLPCIGKRTDNISQRYSNNDVLIEQRTLTGVENTDSNGTMLATVGYIGEGYPTGSLTWAGATTMFQVGGPQIIEPGKNHEYWSSAGRVSK